MSWATRLVVQTSPRQLWASRFSRAGAGLRPVGWPRAGTGAGRRVVAQGPGAGGAGALEPAAHGGLTAAEGLGQCPPGSSRVDGVPRLTGRSLGASPVARGRSWSWSCRDLTMKLALYQNLRQRSVSLKGFLQMPYQMLYRQPRDCSRLFWHSPGRSAEGP
jgi:hypothetical protein